MSERISDWHIKSLLNKIYALSPETRRLLGSIAGRDSDAKREVDKEFWTFEYLWSQSFKDAYYSFMKESFDMFRGKEESRYPRRVSDTIQRSRNSAIEFT